MRECDYLPGEEFGVVRGCGFHTSFHPQAGNIFTAGSPVDYQPRRLAGLIRIATE